MGLGLQYWYLGFTSSARISELAFGVNLVFGIKYWDSVFTSPARHSRLQLAWVLLLWLGICSWNSGYKIGIGTQCQIGFHSTARSSQLGLGVQYWYSAFSFRLVFTFAAQLSNSQLQDSFCILQLWLGLHSWDLAYSATECMVLIFGSQSPLGFQFPLDVHICGSAFKFTAAGRLSQSTAMARSSQLGLGVQHGYLVFSFHMVHTSAARLLGLGFGICIWDSVFLCRLGDPSVSMALTAAAQLMQSMAQSSQLGLGAKWD